MAYTLSLGSSGFIKSDDIIARLDRNVPLQLAHIKAIEEIEANGCRYSNQDFDVLSAAYRAIGKTEIAPHQTKWVERMTAPYPFCRTPHECSSKGYCPKDPACNE